jgi:hypothetical protein
LNRQLYAVTLFALALVAAPAVGQIIPTLGPQVVIQETPATQQVSPGVAFSPAGRYLAVWTAPDADQRFQVFGRLLDVVGAPAGNVFQISSSTDRPSGSRVAASGAGFAVAWVDGGVFLRRYDSHGTPLGDALHIDPPAFEIATGCDVAINAAGEALLV